MAGYTRNDTADNIADGKVINASDLDGEFDAIEGAFNASTGHTHDGTTGGGGPISYNSLTDLPTIPSSYTNSDVDTHLNTSTATNGQVLSWTGSDYDWVDQSAGGGGSPDLYAENSTGYTASTASGTLSFAIGSGASAVGSNSVALGTLTKAWNTYSVSIGIGSTSTSYGAYGSYSIAIGYQSRAVATYNTSVGYLAYSNNTGSLALGYSAYASGYYAVAINDSNATGRYSFAAGYGANATQENQFAFPYGGYGRPSVYSMGGQTTGDASISLLANTTTSGSASQTNQIKVPSNGIITFEGLIQAKNTTTLSNSCAWKITGMAINSAGTITVKNLSVSEINNPVNAQVWVFTDDTNGCLSIYATGALSQTLTWSGMFTVIESV